jgi:hypothetical protein
MGPSRNAVLGLAKTLTLKQHRNYESIIQPD